MVKPPLDVDSVSPLLLKPLTLELLEENGRLAAENAALRAEIARLKGLKSKPDIKPSVPSGMDKATEPGSRREPREKRRRGPKKPSAPVEERVVAAEGIPAGSRFKGYESFTVQDLKIEVRVVCYRRERWLTPDGRTVVAPLPSGVGDHFGPELKRFILAQYHQGQTTVPRLVEFLEALGLDISKRQVVRILTEANDAFVAEARDVLRAGLTHADWISVDDTGARHRGKNGFCTQIGNDDFTFFATTGSKSRANFLDLLRAGGAAFRRHRSMAGPPRPTRHHRAVGQPRPGDGRHRRRVVGSGRRPRLPRRHGHRFGRCRAIQRRRTRALLGPRRRLVHKLETFTATARAAKEGVRTLIWDLYADLKTYRAKPGPRRKAELTARFDRIFKRRTGFASLDRLLARLHANKPELLRVLDRPEIPLHTNGSENDIRCQVIRRKVSGTTRSDDGRDCRDTFLSLAKTCRKLGISFWHYLGARLGAIDPDQVPSLPKLVAARASA
jgi:hypothetical protein